jgi:hypothetical protein
LYDAVLNFVGVNKNPFSNGLRKPDLLNLPARPLFWLTGYENLRWEEEGE